MVSFVTENWMLLMFVVLGILLPRIPGVGKFFNIINTALHEFGHAFVALLTHGTVQRIELFKDTSGTTTTKSDNKFGAILVALAGYPFAASVAWLSFYLVARNASMGLLIGLSVLFLMMLLFWIRNAYGVLWVILFCGVNVAVIYHWPQYVESVALFYATMILMESIASTLTLLVLSFRDSGKAGDATNLQKFTHIPAAVWSLLFVAYTAWLTYQVALMLVEEQLVAL